MDERLLDDYLQELAWLREASGEFARRHPQVAARLRLSEFDCPDPHVERLLEGFALQSARLRRRLDDGYGELCEALLEQLAPHLLRPFPSCATLCFTPDPQAGDLAQGYRLPADTPLYSVARDGETIWWRTTLDQTLWPLTIEEACWCDADFARQWRAPPGTLGALLIRLRCLPPHRFASLAAKSLRVHLGGSPQINALLFDLLYSHAIGPARPRPVGLFAAERILPTEAAAASGGLALSAWMNAPQTMMYFDLPLPAAEGETLTLCIPFNRSLQNAPPLQPGDIRLGCAPAVNLFPRTAEPVMAGVTRSEHRLIADLNRPETQIYRLRELTMSRGDASWRVPPYYSAQNHGEARWFWHARRNRLRDGQLWLTLVDSRFDPAAPPPQASLTAKLWCSNGEAAARQAADTPLTFEQPGPVARVRLLGTPTPPAAPALQGEARWKLLSALALNHLSLTEGDTALAALKEMLALYAPPGAPPELWRQIDGLTAMRCRRVSEHRGDDAWRGWRNGLKVALTFDAQAFTASSRLLFAGVIARFLARNATANCFVRTVVNQDGEELPLWTDGDDPTLIV